MAASKTNKIFRKCLETLFKPILYLLKTTSDTQLSQYNQYRKVLLQTMIKHGSIKDWLDFYELTKSTRNYNERIELVFIMCDAQDTDLLKL